MDSKDLTELRHQNQNQESGQNLWLLDLQDIQRRQQLSSGDNQLRNANNIKKKKRTDSAVKLSEDIEGHIGFKDIEYLEAFINSNDSKKQLKDNISKNSLNAKNETIKKKKSNQMKNKRRNGSKATTSAVNTLSDSSPSYGMVETYTADKQSKN